MARKKGLPVLAVGEFDPSLDIFDMQPWEPPGSYTRFLYFLKAGMSRKLRKVFEACVLAEAKKAAGKEFPPENTTEVVPEASTELITREAPGPKLDACGARWSTWQRECIEFRWEERAHALDRKAIIDDTTNTAGNILKFVRVATEQALACVRDPANRPKTLREATELINAIKEFVRPELLHALVDSSRDAGPEVQQQQQEYIEARPLLEGSSGVHQECPQDHPDPHPGTDQPPGDPAAQSSPGPGLPLSGEVVLAGSHDKLVL